MGGREEGRAEVVFVGGTKDGGAFYKIEAPKFHFVVYLALPTRTCHSTTFLNVFW